MQGKLKLCTQRFVLVSLFLLASTNLFADTISDFEALIPTVVQSFLLLDQNGKSAPALPPGATASPFGALLEFSDPKPSNGSDLTFTLTACSATHLITGEVRSALSCLPATQKGGRAWIYLIYYDAAGKRETLEVKSFVPGQDDSTVTIPIPLAASNGWSSILSQNFPQAEDAWDDPEASLPVTVWAYDSLSLRPDMAGAFVAPGGAVPFGLVFNPRTECLASPKHPIVGIAAKSAPKREIGKVKLVMEDSRGPLLYIDSCNQAFISGNQGALITASGDLQSPLGVYVNSVSFENFWTRISKETQGAIPSVVADPGNHVFYFHQVNGKVERFEPYQKALGENGLCSIGKMFPYLEGYFPEDEDEETP